MKQTIAEKIFAAHTVDSPFPGVSVLSLDRVLCHEITTPIAINDLVSRGMDRVFSAERIKAVIDHVSPAKDSQTAVQGKILRDWAARHGIADFFDIGENGVCHALFPERGFIRPGFTVIMGDSHTCTLGAFAAFAAGVGTTDLEVGILKGVCAFKAPRTIRVTLSGRLRPGVYAKDAILYVMSRLGTAGATNRVIEFGGSVVDALSMEGRMTLCNMAVEAGATSGICLCDSVTVDYLWPFIRDEFPTKEAALASYSRWNSDEGAEYDAVYDFGLSALEPLATVNYKPDDVRPVRELGGTRIDQVYIGSCTNGRIEDLRAAAEVVRAELAAGKRRAPGTRCVVSPATSAVYRAALEEGLLAVFLEAGFCVDAPSCGACLGMSGGVLAEGEACASTSNRNFNGRMGKGGMVHLMSPATAAACAFTGRITNSPLYQAA